MRKSVWRSVLPAVVLIAGCFCTEKSLAEDVSGTDRAVTVNGCDHSLAEFNYYFNSWYDSFTRENETVLPYMFDESRSLKEQEYEDGKTWFDFFVEQACLSMQQILTLSEAAADAGVTISDEQKAEAAQVEEALGQFAERLGMDTGKYLETFYGEGMDETLFEKCLTDSRLAESYADLIRTQTDPTEEEMFSWYQDHLREYTTVAYERFFARASAMGTVPEPDEKQAAEEIAENVLERFGEGMTLKEASQPYAEKGTWHSFEDAQYLEGSVYGDWLFDSSRKDGDACVIEEVNGWYVIVFHERSEAEYLTAQIEDAFFIPDESKGGTDEQLEDSCLRAEAFFAEWEPDKPKGFDSLADAAGDLGGVLETYSALTRDGASKEVIRWAFSGERSEGDCQIVYAPEGFHVLYYAGTSMPAWKVMVLEDLREKAFQETFSKLMENSQLIRNEEVLAHAGGY